MVDLQKDSHIPLRLQQGYLCTAAVSVRIMIGGRRIREVGAGDRVNGQGYAGRIC